MWVCGSMALAMTVCACSYGALPDSVSAADGVSTVPSVSAAGTALPDINGAVCCVVVSSGAPTVVGGVSIAYNGWDTAFISWMVPHFAVASQLAELAPTRSASAKVKTLAAAIDGTLTPNYLAMSALARAWGQPVPSTDPNAGGHDHGGDNSSGADNATTLTKLTGTRFDRIYLSIVIADDKAAQAVARTSVINGANPQAKRLAQTILTDSGRQIAQAQLLLKTAT